MRVEKYQSAIKALIAEQQQVQMTHNPSSVAWQNASREIYRLAELLTGRPAKDACGRRS